ncbi:helical backbone metal receptor [Aliikangiella coralliicola]|uniref:ABC transporter substrate-binding protein n=1 Tax=Aliikangiella coralliicola TaxID=2592383 RepID=A0A545UJK5_9GAMM|nr:helical backbone metal receptor [Aliikangiella coralliicola]TQV89613.1 ABC transporter substrate-binding protein [Aliikangiella coralliicola]
MKIICLVPSITETLIACEADIVGRSRFCIHPADSLDSIPKVGGTKDINWQKVAHLEPDLVILDKEENTLEMATSCPYDYIALHITSINDVAVELTRLAKKISNAKLEQIANRWRKVSTTSYQLPSLKDLPGVIEWWKEPTSQTSVEYLIWQDPWMAIGENTFIQSVLDFCGLQQAKVKQPEKYPQVNIEHYSRENVVLLFSSEPYPFERYKTEMLDLGFSCGLIDGEKYSWYGIRSLNFLESLVSPLSLKIEDY